MKLVVFGIVSLLVQGGGLATFIVVSRMSIADEGKPAIIAVTGLAVCALLWEGVRRSSGVLSGCMMPALLALGYLVAFHLVGLLGFPGLLSDAREGSIYYLLDVLQGMGVLFVFYGMATALFFALNRGFRRIRLYSEWRAQ